MHQRRTVTAGAGADPVLMKKPVADFAGILFLKIQGNDRRAKFPRRIPVKNEFRTVFQFPVKKLRETQLFLLKTLPAFLFHEIPDTGQKPGDPVSVQSSRLQPHRHGGRVLFFKGKNSASAGKQRPDLHTFPHAQAPGSLGTHQTFVARKADHVDIVLLYGNRENSGRLGSIHDKKRPGFPADFPDPPKVVPVSRHVGRVGHHGKLRSPADLFLQIPVEQTPFLIAARQQKLRPLPFHLIEGPENTVMLHHRGNCDFSGL